MSSRSLGDRATSFGAAPCRIHRWYSARLWSSWSLAAFVGIAGSTILPKILASAFHASTKLEPSAFIRGSLESEAQSTTMWAVTALDRRERPSRVETLPLAVCRYCPSTQSVLRASVRSRFPTNSAREGRSIETLLLSTAAPSASTNRTATDSAIRRNHLKIGTACRASARRNSHLGPVLWREPVKPPATSFLLLAQKTIGKPCADKLHQPEIRGEQ